MSEKLIKHILLQKFKLNTKMDSSLDLFIIWIFKPIVILVAFLQVGFLLFYSNNLLGNFCFLQENVRVTDRTYLTPDNKLNTKMDASLDLFITWIFKPMVILVACLQVGFFLLHFFVPNNSTSSALAQPFDSLVSIF